MSTVETAELEVAVHVDKGGQEARRVSLDGEDRNAKWIPRSPTHSFHLTGQTTRGIDWRGQHCILPMAHMTVSAFKARQEGLI